MSHILCNISGKNECAASVLQAQIQTLTQALEGLWARHNDGSPEHGWAEWDTAQDLLEGKP